MAHVDTYLKRVLSECELNYLEDFYDLYDFVSNEDLRKLFAIFHTQLNRWFTTINNDIDKEYDEVGNVMYKGGYFHAQDSRDYLSIVDFIEQLRAKLSSTEYAFRLCDNNYDNAIRRCRRFVAKFGGSNIPEDFAPIEIEELNPIFQISKSIAITQDKKIAYANLRLIGEGSYANVFAYDDPIYRIPIALKRAKSELDMKELARFRQEFEVLKILHSPYVIEVYAYDNTKNEYTLELMDESVYKYIARENSKLPIDERKRIIAQVCRGMSYIHNKGLLHRDISLTNVFIKHYEDVNVVKIGDFGLVKVPESTLTSLQSELKGSLNDPDLINVGFGNYEMCHEIFALTRLCYFILTGKTNIEKQKDGAIKQFWNKGTSPNREERYKSVEELYAEIQKITEKNI